MPEKKATKHLSSPQHAQLDTFSNSHPERDFQITFDCPEFTSLCPITGQPDFGRISIQYIPDTLCLESKSLKLYLFAYRNRCGFHEELINLILDDIVLKIKPRHINIRGNFNPRGGISIEVSTTYPS